jgi:hypothetical protein
MRLSSPLLWLLSSPFLFSSASAETLEYQVSVITRFEAQEGERPSSPSSPPSLRLFLVQSDVSRLRNIVVNSLYKNKAVFLRELLSNANDALEKLRLTSLTDKDVAIGHGELNVTIRAEKDTHEVGGLGRLIIHGQSNQTVLNKSTAKLNISFFDAAFDELDTGIGMTPEELKK